MIHCNLFLKKIRKKYDKCYVKNRSRFLKFLKKNKRKLLHSNTQKFFNNINRKSESKMLLLTNSSFRNLLDQKSLEILHIYHLFILHRIVRVSFLAISNMLINMMVNGVPLDVVP